MTAVISQSGRRRFQSCHVVDTFVKNKSIVTALIYIINYKKRLTCILRRRIIPESSMASLIVSVLTKTLHRSHLSPRGDRRLQADVQKFYSVCFPPSGREDHGRCKEMRETHQQQTHR